MNIKKHNLVALDLHFDNQKQICDFHEGLINNTIRRHIVHFYFEENGGIYSNDGPTEIYIFEPFDMDTVNSILDSIKKSE